MMAPDRPAFGVNYVPREQWWSAWLDFDENSIADDLTAISALGCDHIRIQCLWPVFQPFPTSVSASAMSRLSIVLDRAHDVGLDVWVTVLNGFLSGWVFRPPWLPKHNLFTDPLAISAAQLLLREVAELVSGHPAGAGIDLGNEPNMLVGYEPQTVTQEDLDSWARALIGTVRSAAPDLPVVLGADHQPWTTDKIGFRRPSSPTNPTSPPSTPGPTSAASSTTSARTTTWPGRSARTSPRSRRHIKPPHGRSGCRKSASPRNGSPTSPSRTPLNN